MGIGNFLWPGPQGLQEKETTTPPTKPTNLEIFKVCILENFNIGKELRKIQREEIILNICGGQKGHLKVRHDDRYGAISTALCTLALGQYGARRGAEGHEQRILFLKTVVFSMYKGIGYIPSPAKPTSTKTEVKESLYLLPQGSPLTRSLS